MDEVKCSHGKNRKQEWCEQCFRKESIARARKEGRTSLYEYCDVFGRGNG